MNICRKAIVQNFFKVSTFSLSNKCNFSSLVFKSTNIRCTYSFSKDCLQIQSRFLHVDSPSKSTNVVENSAENESENPDDNKVQDLDSKFMKYADLAADDEQKKKILMILMEHEMSKFEGRRVPNKISVEDMKDLLGQYSFSSRTKYMHFLYEKELRKAADLRKKELKRKQREVWVQEKESIKPAEHIQYGIGHNTMILRVRKKSFMRYGNQRLANSVLHGQKLIIDMDYDCFMRKQDCTNCAEQLLEMYGVNRRDCFPYDLTFCNVDRSSITMSAFNHYMPNLYAPDNFISVTDMSYLELFPKEKLVFITPYAKEPLKEYDHNAVYVLGGLVDKCVREPVVLAKAKREGIRAVHLPFDQYLMWGRGNKSLPLNQLLGILLERKRTNDWAKAFRHVPQRKLVRSLDFFSDFNASGSNF